MAHDINLKTVIKSFEARIAALESKSINYLNNFNYSNTNVIPEPLLMVTTNTKPEFF